MEAINSTQFMTMNSFTLIELSQGSAASGNSLLAVTQQISMSMGVTTAAMLLGGFTVSLRPFMMGDMAISAAIPKGAAVVQALHEIELKPLRGRRA